jgi:hypothetical protein
VRAVLDELSKYGSGASDALSGAKTGATVTVVAYQTSKGTYVASYTRYKAGLGDLADVLPAGALEVGAKWTGRAFVAVQVGVTAWDDWSKTGDKPTLYRVGHLAVKTGSVVGGAVAGAELGGEGGATVGSFFPGPGTVIGGFLGGLGGGLFGAFIGDKASEFVIQRIDQ